MKPSMLIRSMTLCMAKPRGRLRPGETMMRPARRRRRAKRPVRIWPVIPMLMLRGIRPARSTECSLSLVTDRISDRKIDRTKGGVSRLFALRNLVMKLRCGARELDLSLPRVMGILNVTPDSFSDGGRFHALDAALRHAEQMLQDGAELIDIGGESTRPGAAQVGEQEELERVVPVVEAIAARLDVCISIDTSSPAVMSASAAAGAHLLNDVD